MAIKLSAQDLVADRRRSKQLHRPRAFRMCTGRPSHAFDLRDGSQPGSIPVRQSSKCTARSSRRGFRDFDVAHLLSRFPASDDSRRRITSMVSSRSWRRRGVAQRMRGFTKEPYASVAHVEPRAHAIAIDREAATSTGDSSVMRPMRLNASSRSRSSAAAAARRRCARRPTRRMRRQARRRRDPEIARGFTRAAHAVPRCTFRSARPRLHPGSHRTRKRLRRRDARSAPRRRRAARSSVAGGLLDSRLRNWKAEMLARQALERLAARLTIRLFRHAPRRARAPRRIRSGGALRRAEQPEAAAASSSSIPVMRRISSSRASPRARPLPAGGHQARARPHRARRRARDRLCRCRATPSVA